MRNTNLQNHYFEQEASKYIALFHDDKSKLIFNICPFPYHPAKSEVLPVAG